MSNVLLPLRTARNAGLPINRAVVATVVDQIAQRSHSNNHYSADAWIDALCLLKQERDLLSRNTDLCHQLVNRVRVPDTMWMKSFEIVAEAARCSGRRFDASLLLLTSSSPSGSSSSPSPSSSSSLVNDGLVRHLWSALAENGRFQELKAIQEAADSSGDTHARNALISHQLKALLKCARWVSATNLIASLPPAKLPLSPTAWRLPVADTTNLLTRLVGGRRWVEGTNILHRALLEIKAASTDRSSSSVAFDRIGTSAATASLVSAALKVISQAPEWWRPMRAFAMVREQAPRLPLTSQSAALASRLGIESPAGAFATSRFGSLGGTGDSQSSHSGRAARDTPVRQTDDRDRNYTSSSANIIIRNSPGSFDRRRHHHQFHDDSAKAAERAVSLIIQLVRKGKWRQALFSFEQLCSGEGMMSNTTAASTTAAVSVPGGEKRRNKPSVFLTARAAGAIMVHMSKIANWRAAFDVYQQVVAARARVSRSAQMEESDQRALLFVCASQRRWVEAFQLLQRRTRTEAAPVAELLGTKSAARQREGSESGGIAVDRTDRIGIAFHSRPPWDMALRLARAVWPLTAGNNQTRTAILSNVAVAALAHGREEIDSRSNSNPTAGSASHNKGNSGTAGGGPTAIGLSIVDRMLAQGLVPRGYVMALLPEEKAVALVRGCAALPLVEMLLAIRGGQSLKSWVQRSGIHDESSSNDLRDAMMMMDDDRVGAALDVINTSGSGPQKPFDWQRSLKLAAACLERNATASDAFARTKFCKAASEVVYAHAKWRWLEALNIARTMLLTVSGAKHHEQQAGESDPTLFNESPDSSSAATSSSDDDFDVAAPHHMPRDAGHGREIAWKDTRTACAVVLHILATRAPRSHAVAAMTALLDAMEQQQMSLRYYSKLHSPFPGRRRTFNSPSLQPPVVYSEHDPEWSALGLEENTVLARRTVRLVREAGSVSEELRWPLAMRDAFYFCSNFHGGDAALTKEGIAIFDALCGADDAIRKGDGKHIAHLCRVASAAESSSASSTPGWLNTLRYFSILQQRGMLHSESVECFFQEFDSQWLVAANMFQRHHRDAVFRSLIRRDPSRL